MHKNDIAINELIKQYCTNSVGIFSDVSMNLYLVVHLFDDFVFICAHKVLVIIDVKPKDLGLPTEAYISVEEIHDVCYT